jgi:hypothetical protein
VSSSESQSGFSTTRSASLSCRMMSFCIHDNSKTECTTV